MIAWTEKFETGDPLIDQQHQTLINHINFLGSFVETQSQDPSDYHLLAGVLDYLESYAIAHFQHEEQCMEKHRCPAHAQNKEAHQLFIHFFQQFKQRYHHEGYRVEILRELHHSMTLWIQSHILRVDIQLKPCLQPEFSAEAND
ncbi:MAG TPA: bacteriohemerythrin [Verrucomicrobiae bacterium]|nr:bacteriohemerythrin [Verrucomicrobiae bacterium]